MISLFQSVTKSPSGKVNVQTAPPPTPLLPTSTLPSSPPIVSEDTFCMSNAHALHMFDTLRDNWKLPNIHSTHNAIYLSFGSNSMPSSIHDSVFSMSITYITMYTYWKWVLPCHKVKWEIFRHLTRKGQVGSCVWCKIDTSFSAHHFWLKEKLIVNWKKKKIAVWDSLVFFWMGEGGGGNRMPQRENHASF